MLSKTFLRKLHIISQSGCINLHSHQWCTRVPFLHILTNACYLLSFDNCSNRYELIFHDDLYLHFPDKWYWLSFLVSTDYLYVFFEKKNVYFLYHFLIKYLGFCYWILWIPCILWMLIPYQICDFQIFFSVPLVTFLFCWCFLLLLCKNL